MPIAQNQQITLEMILSAQDKASGAIQAVGRELAQMTKGAKVGDLSVGLRESLNKVQTELRENAESLIQIERNVASTRLREARTMRETMARDTRAFFEQEKQALRANLAAETELYREAEREQIAAARDTMRQRLAAKEDPRLVRAETAIAIRDARRQRYGAVADLRSGSQDDIALTQANKEASLDIVRDLYEKRARIVKNVLSDETHTIEQSLADNVRAQRSYGETILTASKELGKEQTRIARETARDVAKAARDGAREAAKTEREEAKDAASAARALAAQQARVDKAGGAVGYGLQETERHVSRFGKAVGTMRESVEGAMGPLHGFLETGKQMAVWGVGYQMMYGVTDALGKMVTGLITTNDSFEQTTKTFRAFYGDAAPRVVTWLDAFAAKTPATREEVRTAGLTIAALGDNIGKVMPPLEDLATVMGVDLPKAAQAFSDAQEGRFFMLKRDLHVSKEELVKYGLDLTNVSGTFVSAFTSFVQDRFGGATQRTIGTFAQVVSNVGDSFHNLQRVAGAGVFDVLKSQIANLGKALDSPILASWAHRTGEDLGRMAQQASTWFNTLWKRIGEGPGVLAMLGQAIHTAQSVWKGLSDTVHLAWSGLSLLVGVLRTAIGFVSGLTGVGRGNTDMLRTMIAVVGDAIIGYRLFKGAVVLCDGAVKLWNMTIGLANKALLEQRLATDAETDSLAKETIATEGAATKTGLLATATSGVTAVAGGFKAMLMASIGPMGIYVGSLVAIAWAIKDVINAYNIAINKMDPAAKKDLTSALTLRGHTGGETRYKFKMDPVFGPVNVPVGTTPESDDQADFVKFLSTFGQVNKSGVAQGQTDAFWAYKRMQETGNPDYWIAYLRKHKKVRQKYLALMTHEGRGDAAQQIISGTSPLLGQYADDSMISGAGATDPLAQALDTAQQQFNYDVARGPKGKQNSERLANALADLDSARSLKMLYLQQVQHKTVQQANDITNKWYKQQLAQIPKAFQAGTYVPGEPTETGKGGGGAGTATSGKDAVTILRAQYDDARAHFSALLAKHPEQAKAMIDSIVALREEYDRARKIPWAATLADEDAVRTRLMTQYDRTIGPAKASSDAHSKLAIDLKSLGDSSKDYARLLSDAARVRKDDLALHHNTLHANAAYLSAIGQVNSHMSSIARSRLKDDLASLGTSAKDQKQLLDDVNKLYADEKRQFPHSKQAHADYENNLKAVTKHMKGTTTGAGGVQVPTPLYGPYRVVTPQYGATQVSFGSQQHNTMAALVQHLQALVTYWQNRARRDEDALRAQQETAQNTRSLRGFQGWSHNAQVPAPPAPASAGAFVRARGGFNIFRRP